MKNSSFFSFTLLANQQPSLHGIRVLGILLVIQFHVWAAFIGTVDQNHPLFKVGTSLWFGMDLFFILSGFLIGTLLLISIEKRGSVTMMNFYARRSFRIIPLYFFVFTVYVLMSASTPADGKYLWAEYLYLTNYLKWEQMHMYWGWSLAVEEHFYIIVPFVMLLLQKITTIRLQLYILTIGWISCFFVRLYIWESHTEAWGSKEWFESIYIPTHTRYDALLAGIWLAIFQKEFGEKIAHSLNSSGLLRISLLSLSVFSFGSIIVADGNWYQPTLFRSLSVGTITSLGWLPLLLYMMNYPGSLSSFFGHPIFRYLATLGYGVYLVHLIVIKKLATAINAYMQSFDLNLYLTGSISIVFTVVVSFAIAYVLHIFVEKPALLVRDKVT